MTPSFGHKNTKWIIHAVGPVYRINVLKDGVKEGSNEAEALYLMKGELLKNAYVASLFRASEQNCATVGFSFLSAGVFRGGRSLTEIAGIACDSIGSWLEN